MSPDPWLESVDSTPGWTLADYQGITVVTKDGNLGGFVAYMAFIPGADTGIAVLSNLDLPIPALSVQWRLVEMLYELEPKVEETLESGLAQFLEGASDAFGQMLPGDRESVSRYLGEYESLGIPYTIEWRDEGLWFGQGMRDNVRLLGSPDGGYVAISSSDAHFMPIQFAEADDGSISLLIAGEIQSPKLDNAAGE